MHLCPSLLLLVFYLLYSLPKDESEEGFFSSLKFWGDDSDTKQKKYHIKLTSQGDNTQVNILDKEMKAIKGRALKQINAMSVSQFS